MLEKVTFTYIHTSIKQGERKLEYEYLYTKQDKHNIKNKYSHLQQNKKNNITNTRTFFLPELLVKKCIQQYATQLYPFYRQKYLPLQELKK